MPVASLMTLAKLKYAGSGLSGSPIRCALHNISAVDGRGFSFWFNVLVTDGGTKVLAVMLKGAVIGGSTSPAVDFEQVGTPQKIGVIDDTCAAVIDGANLSFEYANVGALSDLYIQVFGEITF